MIYTETQLEAIKLFGRKDLTEGCIIRDTLDSSYARYAFNNEYSDPIIVQLEGVFIGQFDDISIEDLQDEEEWEILGHIPHLEDLFRVAEEKNWIIIINNQYKNIFIDNKNGEQNIIPYNPTLQPLDQPSLPEIISLFK